MNEQAMTKDKLLDIIKNNSKHPNCAVTIWLAVEKYLINQQPEKKANRPKPDDLEWDVYE
jgi:hypothetical protein